MSVYEGHGVTLHHGDCLDVLRALPDASVDSVVTDPPYGLEFMGKEWDSFRPDVIVNRGGGAPGRAAWDATKMAPVEYGGAKQRSTLICDGCGKSDKFRNPHDCPDDTGWTRRNLDTSAARVAYAKAFGAWCELWATECLRVLKPGGHLLAFGGTRTWHRLACAVEDAGFEVRDSIAWLYGCLSDDTEILTSEGWVRYDRAKEGQHALAFDTATGALAWQAIQHVHRYPYAGEMVRLRSEHTDQLLTPNHRVVLDEGRSTLHTPYVPSDQDLRRLLADVPGAQPLPVGAEDDVLAGVRGPADLAVKEGQDQASRRAGGPYGAVRDLQDGDVEAGRLAQAERGGVLLEPVQRCAPCGGAGEALPQGQGGLDRRQPGVLPGEDDRAEQPRMEGRRYRVQEARELCRSAVRASAGVGAADGPHGRVHHGAPATDGRPLRVPADQSGSHQPREPRSQGQPTGEPDPLAVEPGAQALRVGEDGGGRLLPSTGVTADVVDYAGVVWCITVPHGAFIARRNGLIFATGNSGFPKSLDVSKAIDKRRTEDAEPVRAICRAIRAAMDVRDLRSRHLVEHFDGCHPRLIDHWAARDTDSQPALPTWEQWEKLRDLFAELAEHDAEAWRLNGRKGSPGEAWESAEVIGTARGIDTATSRLGFVGATYGGTSAAKDYDVKAPASSESQSWQGWGTALKPSFEGIVCATKPVPALARIGSRLDELEQSCRPPASGAVPSSAPTHPDSLGARTASAPASAATRREDEPARTTPTGAAGGSSAATATSASELTGATFWNTVTSWKACWAELCEATSTSTTGTTSSTTTDLETLWSCLSQITPESTTTDPTSPDGLSSLVGAVDAMFAAAVLNSRATRTLTAIGSATSGTPPTSPAAGGSRAAFEPVVVARKPLAGTVAANVLEHGTGALNIDATRIGTTDNLNGGGYSGGTPKTMFSGLGRKQPDEFVQPSGRWPANVILDESQAAALDEQSGTLTSGANPARRGADGDRQAYGEFGGQDDANPQRGSDSGGASRFFYVAKADASERPRVNGTAHPTVKPLDLMRWLVRLVTPPGGTVLEPFAGSGTTVEACIVEGFQCIAIEREADYLPLIRQRIDRRRDPVEALRGQAADLGLFDLLGGELA